MATFEDCSFKGTTVILDGNEYNKCMFKGCKIVVTRGNFSLRKSSFDGCKFEFGGEAANIRNLVTGILGQGKSTPQNKEPQQ